MTVRNYVRQFLRRYGRAAVVTVHERLNVIEDRLNSIDHHTVDIASTQTALLQANIHLVEGQAQSQRGQEADFAAVQASLAALEPIVRELRSLESIAQSTNDFLANQSIRQVCVETFDYASTNPELGLMSFLYSYLPSRNAIDIGAHTGEVSQHLLNAGYDVYAFEPYPPSYTRLTERLNGQAGFHSFQLVLGSENGEATLHLASDSTDDGTFDDPTVFHSLVHHEMPAGLVFDDSVSVAVQRLTDLHGAGLVPPDVSLVKIDTEGYDLEVIRGMSDRRYAVVAVEFWDGQIPFAKGGLQYTLDTMVSEMRQRGYFWYIVVYRVWGQNQIAFFCNHDRAVPNSWGNIFFFQALDTFRQAQDWCSAILPRTYFKPVASHQRAPLSVNGSERN